MKMTLELKAIGVGEVTYQVVKVINSIQWTPGDVLDRAAVSALLRRPNLTIIVR